MLTLVLLKTSVKRGKIPIRLRGIDVNVRRDQQHPRTDGASGRESSSVPPDPGGGRSRIGASGCSAILFARCDRDGSVTSQRTLRRRQARRTTWWTGGSPVQPFFPPLTSDLRGTLFYYSQPEYLDSHAY